MDMWSKIKIDYEQLGFTIAQLEKKYSVSEAEIQLRIDLDGWETNDPESTWPDLFQKHDTVGARIEVLEYLTHESLYHKAFKLEHEIYSRLLEVVDKIDPEFPKTSLDLITSVIRQFHSLKQMKLAIFETFNQQKSEEPMDSVHMSGLSIEGIIGQIDDVNDLKFFKTIIKRIEAKQITLNDKSSPSGSIVTRIH